MIRLSRLADYAVALMCQLADEPERMRTGTGLAAILRLPAPTVSKLLTKLTRVGLLTSYRGVDGGYALARSIRDVTVADIISAVDGPIAMTDCVEEAPGACTIEAFCPSRTGLQKINVAVRTALEGVTLADVMPQPIPWKQLADAARKNDALKPALPVGT
jgi:FeS assembly SUF system regulator